MRSVLVVGAVFCLVACGRQNWQLEGYGADSDHALPYLDPTLPVAAENRSVQYSVLFEDDHSAQGLGVGPMSVALEYRNTPLSFRGWCVDVTDHLDNRITYGGKLYSSSEPIPPGSSLAHPENLELVNYLVANRPVGSAFSPPNTRGFEITDDVMQGALWALVSTGVPEWLADAEAGAEIAALVDDARSHGRGFRAQGGDHTTMIVVGNVNLDGREGNEIQTLAIDVSVPGAPGICGWDAEHPCESGEPPR